MVQKKAEKDTQTKVGGKGLGAAMISPAQYFQHLHMLTTWKHSKPYTYSVFVEHHHVGLKITNLVSSSSPLPEDGKLQAFNSGLIFLVTSPHPEAIQDPTRVASLEQKTVLSPRKCQGIQVLCVRNQGQRSNIRKKKDVSSVLIT